MSRHVYVGNLSPETGEETLRAAFERGGRSVRKVSIVTDRTGRRSRGFAFIEMEDDEGAAAAIAELDGELIDGRPIRVREGKERPEFQVRPANENRGGRRGRR